MTEERRMVKLKTRSDVNPLCPDCGCNQSSVTNTYHLAGGRIRRRRVCDHCQNPFFTTQGEEKLENSYRRQ